MKTRWILPAALVVLAPFAVAPLLPAPARGEEPVPASPPKKNDPMADVAELMTLLRMNEGAAKGAVRVGMVAAKADRATPGAAKHIDQRYLPLAGSWLDPEGRLRGTVDWDTDLDTGKRVDSIQAVLLTGPYDRKEMAKAVIAAGKSLGLNLEPDDEDPDTYFDYKAKGIELWVTLGDGIAVIEAEAAD